MIVEIPNTFTLNEDTKAVFLFYQCVNELTYDYAPDSYKAPIHNTRSLCMEALEIYSWLKKDDLVGKYYTKYIIPIIQELIDSLKIDTIAKALLAEKYDAYIQLLQSAGRVDGKDPYHAAKVFEKHMGNLLDMLNGKKYYKALRKRLNEVAEQNPIPDEFVVLVRNVVCMLIDRGFSRQHIYQTAKGILGNTKVRDKSSINRFFGNFRHKPSKWSFLAIVPTALFTAHEENLNHFFNGYEDFSIRALSKEQLQGYYEAYSTRAMSKFKETFSQCNANDEIYCIALITSKAFDPYSADAYIRRMLNLFFSIILWFEHENYLSFNHSHEMICLNYRNAQLIRFTKPMYRYYKTGMETNTAERVNMFLASEIASPDAVHKLLNVFKLHSDAYSHNMKEENIFLSLWTAMELLFADDTIQENKASQVISGMLDIIQRTYILKTVKYMQTDLLKTLDNDSSKYLIEKYNLTDIRDFIKVLYDIPSGCQQELLQALKNNYLLLKRLRLFSEVDFKDGKQIEITLANHHLKIKRQILRIYRARNLLVHSNYKVKHLDVLLEHLHNYIDFFVNHIICKLEQDKVLKSIDRIVSEVELDNQIHSQYLKENKSVKTANNPICMLFGPNDTIIDLYEGKPI